MSMYLGVSLAADTDNTISVGQAAEDNDAFAVGQPVSVAVGMATEDDAALSVTSPTVAAGYTQVRVTGTDPASTVGVTSTMVSPDDRMFLYARNTSGSPVTVTVVVPWAQYGQGRPDAPTVVAATTGTAYIGPLTADLADPTTGLVTFTVSPTSASFFVDVVRI